MTFFFYHPKKAKVEMKDFVRKITAKKPLDYLIYFSLSYIIYVSLKGIQINSWYA